MTASDQPTRSEAELVAAWRSGDLSAFYEIIRIHRRRLFAVAFRRTGDAQRAEDAVQVGLYNAQRAVTTVDADGNLGGWLATIVLNAARDESRRDVRHQRIVSRALGAAVSGAGRGATGHDPARLEAIELGRILHAAIARLPAPYGRAVELFHVHGLCVADVALALDTNENTVKSHLARGRALLQRSLEGRLRKGGYL